MKNPVSVIMECLTNKQWGHGIDPKNIDAEELQKMRDRYAASTDGNFGPVEHFTAERPKGMPWGGSSEQDSFVKGVSPEQLAVDAIRAKVEELNEVISMAAMRGIRVEISALDHHSYDDQCTTTHITAEISKKL